jgi:Mrp family chromosome partitioning ATPase
MIQKMEKALMKSVEKNNMVENEQSAVLADPSQTQKLPSRRLPSINTTDIEAETLPVVSTEVQHPAKKDTKAALQKAPALPLKRAQKEAQVLRIRCKQLCVSTFFQGHTPIHSLGFTSAIAGEGKSFLARVAAEVMTEDDSIPVTLLECNWENPSFDTAFHLAQGPGLAEWLREDCNLSSVRYQIHHNLTVIPAGNSKNNAVGLLQAFRQRNVLDLLNRPNELLIVDLPAITTTPYGQLAASLVDGLILVVRMGVTPEGFITEANSMLKGLPMQGVIFNQVKSHVPRWLRQML